MEEKILGYVDGRLKESDRVQMEKHLATCAACRLRVNEFRAVTSLLDELPVIEPSEAFDLRVHARVAAEPAKQSWWAWLHVQPRIAFVASALLVAVLWLGYRAPLVQPVPQVDDAQLMQDLPVLEDHDVLSNFEPLKELPPPVQNEEAQSQQQPM